VFGEPCCRFLWKREAEDLDTLNYWAVTEDVTEREPLISVCLLRHLTADVNENSYADNKILDAGLRRVPSCKKAKVSYLPSFCGANAIKMRDSQISEAQTNREKAEPMSNTVLHSAYIAPGTRSLSH
jgi:hypothetical protein